MKMDYIVFLDGNLFEVSASTKTRVTDDDAVTFYELFYILQISQGLALYQDGKSRKKRTKRKTETIDKSSI